MRCDLCGQEGARVRRVTRSYGEGDDLFVIRNVPVVKCSRCGESYLTAQTLHEIERLKADRHNVAREATVAVADFAT